METLNREIGRREKSQQRRPEESKEGQGPLESRGGQGRQSEEGRDP